MLVSIYGSSVYTGLFSYFPKKLFTSGMLYKELITLPIGTYAKDGDITEDEEIELIELVRGLGDDVLKAYENRKKANQ